MSATSKLDDNGQPKKRAYGQNVFYDHILERIGLKHKEQLDATFGSSESVRDSKIVILLLSEIVDKLELIQLGQVGLGARIDDLNEKLTAPHEPVPVTVTIKDETESKTTKVDVVSEVVREEKSPVPSAKTA